MQPVSESYKQAVYAPERRTTARVTFEILDIDAFEDNIKTATSEAIISRLEQVTNKKRNMTAKYATFEPDYWKLDGSFVFPPEPGEEPEAELGWWSGDLCDAAGVFDPHQVIEFVFSKEHSSVGLSISFDPNTGEHAKDFEIHVYAAGDTLIYTEIVTNNTEAKYILVKPLDSYKKVAITIKRWAKGYRRARIAEVDFGVVKEYAGDNLIKINLLEEMSTTSEILPAGENQFTVDNSNREFNILNPEGFYRFLQERQEVTAEIGVEVSPNIFEYVKMGQHYLSEWKSNEGSLTATFTALDVISLLDNYEIEKSTATATNLYDYATEILTTAKIPRHEIDIDLKDVATQAVHRKMDCRQILRHILIAGQAVAYADRDGKLIIKRLLNTQPVDNITFDNVYDEPQIKLDKLVSAVEVTIFDNGEKIDTYRLQNGVAEKGVVIQVESVFINDITTAQAVAQWVLAEANKREIYEVKWRQNPALELADIVTLENAYGVNKPSRIIRQEYEYQGALSGTTELKGDVS